MSTALLTVLAFAPQIEECGRNPDLACSNVLYACESDRVIQGTLDNAHRGFDLATLKWPSDSARDILAGGALKWDDEANPSNAATSAMLYTFDDSECCTMQEAFGFKGEYDGDRFGWGVSNLGDIDGDGFGDFAVGAPRGPYDENATPAYTERGRVYVFLSGSFIDPGFVAPETVGDLPSARPYANVILEGAGDFDRLGWSIAPAGDFDGSSATAPHIVIGAPGGPNATAIGYKGRAYVVPGQQLVNSAAIQMGAAPVIPVDTIAGVVTLTGRKQGDLFGFDVALAGDVDGNGTDDVVVGAPQFMETGGGNFTSSGKGYARVYGNPSPTVPMAFLEGTAEGDRFGFSVHGNVNTNGDVNPRTTEVVIGAPNFNGVAGGETGAGYVYSIRPTVQLLWVAEGTQADEGAGWDVLGVGEFSGVGEDDVAIGSRYYSSLADTGLADPTCSQNCFGELASKGGVVGRVRVYEGATGALCLTVVGEHERDSLGWSLARIGDVGETERADIAIGAMRWNSVLVDPPDPAEPGRIYTLIH